MGNRQKRIFIQAKVFEYEYAALSMLARKHKVGIGVMIRYLIKQAAKSENLWLEEKLGSKVKERRDDN